MRSAEHKDQLWLERILTNHEAKK
jgi:hypothetical protein